MIQRALIAIFVITCLFSSALAEVKVIVDAKNGDAISGERKFKVIVQSKHLVTKVEFILHGKIVSEEESTPYIFNLDTIAEKEGDIELLFRAYNFEGEVGETKLKLKIDNGLSKGADYFVQKATEALQTSKWDEAINNSRIALKAKANYPPAKMTMARAYFGKGIIDEAQRNAEDVVRAEPNNRGAKELLIGINLRRAFMNINRGGDRKELPKLLKDALVSAVGAYQAVLQEQIDNFGPVTEANLIAYADLTIRANRYSLAITQLEKVFRKDPQDPTIANRLIYALLRAGRLNDAYQASNMHLKYGKPDAYGYALRALIATQLGDDKLALDAEREALLADSQNVGVRSAQAFLALRRSQLKTFDQIVKNLEKVEGQRSEVNYYLFRLHNILGNTDQSNRSFEQSALAQPNLYDLYVERANIALAQALSPKTDKKLAEYMVEISRVYIESALLARPESYQVLTALALVNLVDGKVDEALRMALAATTAGPEYAAGFYVLSSIYNIQKKTIEANKALEKAGKLDTQRLEGRILPDRANAWLYFARFGGIPVIPAPSK